MSFIPSPAHGGDHLVDHGRAVGSLGNTGRGAGSIGAGDDVVLLAETDLGLVGRNSAADGGVLGAPFSEIQCR